MENVLYFPSLNKADELAYTAHRSRTDLWDSAYRASRPIAYWAGSYLTYGDGMVQHSHESVVCAPLFEDYLASLAAHLLAHPEDAETVAYMWPQQPADRDVRFALSVKHKPGSKDAYYNLRERKMSTRESLRYDKRWTKVEEWMDGSAASAYRILRGEDSQMDLIEAFHLYDQCRNVAYDVSDRYDQHPVDYFDLEDKKKTVIRQAFDAADFMVRSWRARHVAEGQMDCYRSNTAQRKKVEAEETTATV